MGYMKYGIRTYMCTMCLLKDSMIPHNESQRLQKHSFPVPSDATMQ